MHTSPRKLPHQARAQATVDATVNATSQATADHLIKQGYAKTSTNAVAQVSEGVFVPCSESE